MRAVAPALHECVGTRPTRRPRETGQHWCFLSHLTRDVWSQHRAGGTLPNFTRDHVTLTPVPLGTRQQHKRSGAPHGQTQTSSAAFEPRACRAVPTAQWLAQGCRAQRFRTGPRDSARGHTDADQPHGHVHGHEKEKHPTKLHSRSRSRREQGLRQRGSEEGAPSPWPGARQKPTLCAQVGQDC